MKLHQVDAVPAPRLMQTIGATALSPTAAVAELVANSLDARLDERNVRIEVRLLEGRIEVVDDAKGMALEVLKDALRLGVDMDKRTRMRSGRMGTYGLGMKTAAASLGDRWGIVTRPAGSNTRVEYRARFDLREWASRGSSSDAWTIGLEEDAFDSTGPLGERTHGTVIWIEDLRFKDHLPGPYLDHLSRAFAPFIKEGHIIVVNDKEAAVSAPRLAEGTFKEFNQVIDEQRGWLVRGWVGLDTKTHNDGSYGIHLYRHDQLIELHNKEFFKPHLMTSRILGEAHLDFVPVNFNKVDFSKGTEEWKFAKAAMEELIKPVAEASRIMSRGRHDDSRITKAVAKLNEAFQGPAGFAEADSGSPLGGDASEQEAALPAEAPQASRLKASGRTLSLPHSQVHIDAQLDELTSPLVPWDYIYVAEKCQLLVVVNQESAVFKKMKDVDFLSCIAVADCISRFLIERQGVDSSKARRVSNEWLHEAVTGKPIWQQDTEPEIGRSAAS